MFGYEMEAFEIMGDAMDEVQAWMNFEADLAESDPWAELNAREPW